MQPDDPEILRTDCDEPQDSTETVLELLHNQLRNNIAPLGLEIDCAELRLWARENGLERFRHQYLVRELRAWNRHLGRKSISRVWIREPFSLLDAPSLTEVVYAIGQNLRLLTGQHAEHAATLLPEDFTRQNIALLKGLEFNHILIQIPADFRLADIQTLHATLAEFKFPYISLHLDADAQDQKDFALQLMEILSFIQPATLTLNPLALAAAKGRSAPDDECLLGQQSREGMTALLMQFGYYLQPPHTLLRFHSPLHKRPQDCIRLGPAARSQFGPLEAHNLRLPNNYKNRIQNGHLPIATCH